MRLIFKNGPLKRQTSPQTLSSLLPRPHPSGHPEFNRVPRTQRLEAEAPEPEGHLLLTPGTLAWALPSLSNGRHLPPDGPRRPRAGPGPHPRGGRRQGRPLPVQARGPEAGIFADAGAEPWLTRYVTLG